MTEYRLESIGDLAAVPVERLDACFADLKRAFLAFAAIRVAAGDDAKPPSELVWHDDGQPFADARLVVAETGEQLLSCRIEPGAQPMHTSDASGIYRPTADAPKPAPPSTCLQTREFCARIAEAVGSRNSRDERWLADDIVMAIRDPEAAVQKLTTKIALANNCDRGTFTACWRQYEKRLPCKCEDEARAVLRVPPRRSSAT